LTVRPGVTRLCLTESARRQRCLPVMRDGKLAGFVTRADLLKVMAAHLSEATGTENPTG
jgi:CBS domain-containing protein